MVLHLLHLKAGAAVGMIVNGRRPVVQPIPPVLVAQGLKSSADGIALLGSDPNSGLGHRDTPTSLWEALRMFETFQTVQTSSLVALKADIAKGMMDVHADRVTKVNMASIKAKGRAALRAKSR